LVSNIENKSYLIVIGGPTAVGKTSVSIELANAFGTEILSADSRQCYREMNIGTAKPSRAERSLAKHHFIDNISIHEDYTVGDFEREAIALLENELFKSQNTVLMTGGTGLYIKAVCEGLNNFPEVDLVIHESLIKEYECSGITPLQEELKKDDPIYFEQADNKNPHRIIRALGVIRSSGNTFSQYWNTHKTPRCFTPIYISLTLPREELYKRINNRVDLMIKEGLLEEARALHEFRHLRSLQTVGYQELFQHFEGYCSMDEAISKIKQHSRNYAKRQMTWFRNQGNWHEMDPADIPSIILWIKEQIN
jgi:tRNA dimethylallyltransferase